VLFNNFLLHENVLCLNEIKFVFVAHGSQNFFHCSILAANTSTKLDELNQFTNVCKGCFLKFGVEVGVEESIVNEPLVLKTLIFQIAD
jgi:hypothetical protein